MIGLRKLIVRNFTMQSVSEAVGLACGLAASALLSRHLGVAGFGAFNYAFAFIYFFLTLNDLGLTTAAVREISREPDRAAEILGSLLSLRLAVAGCTFVAACAAIFVWPMDDALRLPLLGFAFVLPLNALGAPSVIFQTAMRFEYAAISNIVTRVSGLLFMIVMMRLGGGVSAMLAALVVADACGAAVTWLLARRMVRVTWRVDRAGWRLLAGAAVPLAVSLMLSALLNRIDFLMLERMASIEAVGLYAAAYRVTSMLEKFPIFIMGTLYPVMSILAATDRPRLRQVYRRGFWRLALAGFVFASAVVVAAPWLMTTVFGAPFIAAVPALRWLVVATVCLYLAMSGGYLLIAVGRARDNVIALGAGAVVNIALNLVLIPARGIDGAAIATAVSFAIVLAVTLVAVERSFALSAPVVPAL